MGLTKIEWCDYTFNPWIGCAKVSPGCQHCYAETLMDSRWGKVKWGINGTRVRTSDVNWRKPMKWNEQAQRDGVRRKVFCASLADVFEDRADVNDWRFHLWSLIDCCQSLDWLLLTKRPENFESMLPWTEVPFHNVWLGVSAEDQKHYDQRVSILARTPVALRFVSAEPLFGHIDIHSGIGWVIVGGESGVGARQCSENWVHGIVHQCRQQNVPVFVKQLGSNAIDVVGNRLRLRDRKGGDPNEWPKDLRVREFPMPVN